MSKKLAGFREHVALEGAVLNWLALALAHHQLGHADEARQWLDKAQRRIDKASAEAPAQSLGPLAGMSRGAWLTCRVLQREAKMLINATTPKEK